MTIVVLGIDPSLRRTGWGIIQIEHDTIRHIEHGVITPKPTLATEKRLSELSKGIAILIDKYKPNVVAIEETFCGINPATTLRLGFAFGAILSTCGQHDIPTYPYATRLIKRHLASIGSAKKEDVQIKVLEILNLDIISNLDSSDALAAAITHAKICLIPQIIA